ncbi:hypothetical protein [uncultured Marinobacter sp.]|nr:hypothetical protein [uncultured Marinobacter sp.]
MSGDALGRAIRVDSQERLAARPSWTATAAADDTAPKGDMR